MPAIITDESGFPVLDESYGDIYDESGPSGIPVAVSASVTMTFHSASVVGASVTMEFEAGVPVQDTLTTLASDPWISMYPG